MTIGLYLRPNQPHTGVLAMNRFARLLLIAPFAVATIVGSVRAQESNEFRNMVARGFDYLRDKGQAEDGTFSARAGSGITALAVTAALRHGHTTDDPLVARGLEAMEQFVQPDGGIYGSDRLRNYETCVGILCFSEANTDGRYDEILKNAENYIRGLQIDAEPGADKSHPWYGGVGYGGPERPDLSNTSYLVEALVAVKAAPDDPAIQRALVFASRCQNLAGQGNDTEFAGLVNDGGFYYSIPLESSDRSSERYDVNGGLRSYGSMTYSGLKSLIYAGLTKEDPRTKAALEWIGKHYSLTENPGMGNAGIYYYYHTFGAALKASGLDQVADAAGQSHDWNSDLIAELGKEQREDGSWVNSNRQWFENDPNLCTAFALMALSYCDEAAQEHD